MKVSTHRAIARAVAYAIGMNNGQMLDALLKGVSDPDVYPESELHLRASAGGNIRVVSRRVKHHSTANRNRIMKHLWAARKAYLAGRMVEAAYRLGWAMHYIQDMCVAAWNHSAHENELRRTPIPVDIIDRAACLTVLPSDIQRALQAIGTQQTAMRDASAVSAAAAAAVFSRAVPPRQLVEELNAAKGKHRLLSGAAAALVFAGLLSLTASPILALGLFAAAMVSYGMDGKYRGLKKELEWFRF